jgi:hypothetical protein
MSTVQDIEAAIQHLPEHDVVALAQWLDEYAETQWDKRIEADAQSGALRPLAEEAKAARRAGQLRRFP